MGCAQFVCHFNILLNFLKRQDKITEKGKTDPPTLMNNKSPTDKALNWQTHKLASETKFNKIDNLNFILIQRAVGLLLM